MAVARLRAMSRIPAALLVIDMINRFDFDGGKALARAAEPASKRIAWLRGRFHAAGWPVVMVNDNFMDWKADFREICAVCSQDGMQGAEIARRSRGTPRIANRLLRRVRDYAEVRADGVITRDVAKLALEVYDVDELGLDRLDRAVLSALTRSFGGGPVGVSTLAVAVGEEPTTVEEVCEPFLVRAGMIALHRIGELAFRAYTVAVNQQKRDAAAKEKAA